MMSDLLHELANIDPLASALLGHYATTHGRDRVEIVDVIVDYFSQRDRDLDEDVRVKLRTTSDILHHYRDSFDQHPASILATIIVEFTRNDPDFDEVAFTRDNDAPELLEAFRKRGMARTSASSSGEVNASGCPFSGAIDRFSMREIRDHDRIDGHFETKVRDYRCPIEQGPTDKALRGIHARGLGTLHGHLTVTASNPLEPRGLPSAAPRLGVFETPDTRLKVIMRYSTSGGPNFEAMPDNDEEQAIGLGLKILTQSGQTAHDLLFINSPVFMTNDPVELVFQDDASSLRDSYAASRDEPVFDALDETQFTASAFAWGYDRAVKYRLRPLQKAAHCVPDDHQEEYQRLGDERGPQFLETRITTVFQTTTQPLHFALEVQFADPEHVDSHGAPIDDERIEWRTTWFELGNIEMPPQRTVQGEDLAFHPFHVSDAGLLPLGRLNRARLRSYDRSRNVRHAINEVKSTAHPYQHPASMRVAVVGGGASGLASALALASFGYKVDVYERLRSLGGHACAKDVFDGKHRRDPAFGAFRERQWPNLWRLLQELEVEPISHGRALDWFDSPFAGWFTRDAQAVSRSHEVLETMQAVVLAFTRALREPDSDGRTVGDLFDDLGVSDDFIRTGFLGGIVHYFAGHPVQGYLNYPLRLLAWMWLNNADRQDDEPIELFQVDNDTYIERFAETLQKLGVTIRTGVDTQVRSRSQSEVVIQDRDRGDDQGVYARLILAIQPHHALRVLGDFATEEERQVLGGFEHTIDTVVIHRDTNQLPRDPKQWKLFNVELPSGSTQRLVRSTTLPITIVKTCTKDCETPIFALYDYANAPDSDIEGERFTFEHLKVTPATQKLRRSLTTLQGVQGVHYCGSWSRGLTLHEDALVTGFQAANRILGGRQCYPILDPPVPLPEPFGELRTSRSAPLGRSREELLSALTEMLNEILPGRESVAVAEETELQGLVTSSLHLARLATALSTRMSDPDAIDISELMHLETIGELIDFISMAQDDLPDETHAQPGATTEFPRLPMREWEGKRHPITLAQKNILISQFLSRERNGEWNIAIARWIDGPLETTLLESALSELISHHSGLRTRFYREGSQSFTQEVVAKPPPNTFFEFPASSDEEALLLAKAQVDAPLDVTEGVLRIRVIRRSPTRILLLIVVHHAVADGLSVGVIMRGFWSSLRSQLDYSDEASILEQASAQQIDAAYWEAEALHNHRWDQAIEYWRKTLARPLPKLRAPKELRARAFGGSFILSAETMTGLRHIAREHKTSLNVVLLTLYAQTLGRCTELGASDELLVRIPIAARAPETEGIVGSFADAIALRVPCHSDSYAAALERTHERLYDGLKYQTPFSLLWRELGWGPAELMELNQVILNLEQTVDVLNEKDALGEAFRIKAVEDEGALPDYTTIRSMLSLNESAHGTYLGQWQWSSELADENLGRAILIDSFQVRVDELLNADLQKTIVSDIAGPNLPVVTCPFHDLQRDVSRESSEIKTLIRRYDETEGQPENPDDDIHLGTLTARFQATKLSEGRGIFADDGSVYDATLRLSLRFGAGGLGLKVHRNQLTLHDLLFLTTRTMPNDPIQLVDSAGSNQEHSGSDPLFEPYHSISAYGWTRTSAVKYRLRPDDDLDISALLDEPHRSEYEGLESRSTTEIAIRTQRLALLLRHTTQEIVLVLEIQRASHPDRTPIDDTLVEWQEDFEPVGTLTISAQALEAKHDAELRFQPYHVSDEVMLPLGRLNRFRHAIYAHTQSGTSHRYPHDVPTSLKVGIVGGGASGLRAALALSSVGYRVTVFERSKELGGHACTKEVLGGEHLREPAFGAFREAQWPNLMALLDSLQVPTHSHGASHDWLDSPFVGWWRKDAGWVQPSAEVEEEAKRFIVALSKCLTQPDADGETVGALVQRLGLSNDFITTWFAGGVIHYFAGQPLEYYLSYPARLLAWMWLNNAEREDGAPIQLLKVDNQHYISTLAETLRAKGVSILTETSVTVSKRTQGQVQLTISGPGQGPSSESFGHVILAVQPHHCLTVLANHSTVDERAVLGGFHHTVDVVRIHRESPTGQETSKLLTIMLPSGSERSPTPQDTLPMVITKACERDNKTPIYASYNYADAKLYEGPDAFPFEHVQVTPDTQRLRQRLKDLQGVQNIHFCGSWSRGLTLHEDAIVSALECANRILGPGKSIEILKPPVPMPEPFEEVEADDDGHHFGRHPDDILDSLIDILETVLDSTLTEPLTQETALGDIQLSSLHFARLANAIGSRLPPDLRDEVDILVLLQMETLGELADFLGVLLEEHQPQASHAMVSSDEPPPETAEASVDSNVTIDAKLKPDVRKDVTEPTSQTRARRDVCADLPMRDEIVWDQFKAQSAQAGGIAALGLTLATASALAVNAFQNFMDLGILGIILALPGAYGVFAIAYTLTTIIVKSVVVGRLEPGRYALFSQTHLRWWTGNLFMRFGQQFVWAPLGRSSFGRWLLKTFGATVAPNVVTPIGGTLPSFALIDADLLTVEERVYIRPTGTIRAHMFIDGQLVLAPTRLCSDSVVWSRALVEPGATLGPRCNVEPQSVVSMGQSVAADSVFDGIPGASVADRTPSAAPVIHPLEATTHLFSGLVAWPLIVGISIMLPLSTLDAVLPSFTKVLSVPLFYPLWLITSLAIGWLVAQLKAVLLGTLAEGQTEEDFPVTLPIVQSLTAAIGSMSWLWPRSFRRGLTRWFGGNTHQDSVTDEAFMDLTYADLFTRENGTFFSSAAFLDFTFLEDGKRVLKAITLKTGSYVGAYSTLQAPCTLEPATLVGACSRLPNHLEAPPQGAWVGVPARPVPLRTGDVDPEAFTMTPADVQRLSQRADLHRYALVTLMVGATALAGSLLQPEANTSILEYFVLLGGIWLTALIGFSTVVRQVATTLKKTVHQNPELQQSGIGRQHRLLSDWSTNLFHMAPLGLLSDILSGTSFKTMLVRWIGADIDDTVYIANGVGFSDIPYLRLESGVTINEGAALIAHSELPNGTISLKELGLEKGSVVLWSGYLTGGSVLPESTILGSASRPFDGQELDEDAEYNNTPCRRHPSS